MRPRLRHLGPMAALALSAAPSSAGLPVADRDVGNFAAGLERSDVGAVRGIVGERVLKLVRMHEFERSDAAAIVAVARGCRRHSAERVPGNDAVFVEFVCAGRSRQGLEPEEDPGLLMRVWQHPSGAGLAVSFQETGVMVRPRTRPLVVAPPPTVPEAERAER